MRRAQILLIPVMAAIVMLTLFTTTVSSTMASAAVPTLVNGTPPTYSWPEFHYGPDLLGTSADPTITSSNAHQLGVKWMSPIGGSLASPMVAYNAALSETLAYVGTCGGIFRCGRRCQWADRVVGAVGDLGHKQPVDRGRQCLDRPDGQWSGLQA